MKLIKILTLTLFVTLVSSAPIRLRWQSNTKVGDWPSGSGSGGGSVESVESVESVDSVGNWPSGSGSGGGSVNSVENVGDWPSGSGSGGDSVDSVDSIDSVDSVVGDWPSGSGSGGGSELGDTIPSSCICQCDKQTRMSAPVPVVLLHGIASSCEELCVVQCRLEYLGIPVYNLEIGNGYLDSIGTPMTIQLNSLCQMIKDIPHLQNGFHGLGISQGTLLLRGCIEQCPVCPMINFISWVGPHGGVFYPEWEEMNKIVYEPYMQMLISGADYYRNPYELDVYLEKSSYLAKLNNERLDIWSPIRRQRMCGLKRLVLFWSSSDGVINPPESGKFYTYYHNSTSGELYLSNEPMWSRLCLDVLDPLTFDTGCHHSAHTRECLDQMLNMSTPYLVEPY